MAGGAAGVSPIRTIVYVDGFNLYFGCLKGTPYKWLNVAELCRRSLPSRYQLRRVRYFTALVTSRPSDRREFHKHVRVLSPRGKSWHLSQAATRFQQITIANLQAAQFPPILTDANGTITKPTGW